MGIADLDEYIARTIDAVDRPPWDHKCRRQIRWRPGHDEPPQKSRLLRPRGHASVHPPEGIGNQSHLSPREFCQANPTLLKFTLQFCRRKTGEIAMGGAMQANLPAGTTFQQIT